MVSVAAVSPRNPKTPSRRRSSSRFLVAVVVTPFAWFWFLIIPGVIALVAWFLVYTIAYDIGFGQAFAAGLVQVALGTLVDLPAAAVHAPVGGAGGA